MVLARKDSTQELALELPLSPEEMMSRATKWANVLMKVVEERKFYADIAGKKYMEAEGWALALGFAYLDPVPEYVRPVERDGKIIGMEAKVNLLKNGVIAGGGIATCGFDQFPCKGKEGEAKTQAAGSAAQTWAMSRAARLKLGFVAKLAGYEATPADEMRAAERELLCPTHGVPLRYSETGKYGPYYSHKLTKEQAKQEKKEWCSWKPDKLEEALKAQQPAEETSLEQTTGETPEVPQNASGKATGRKQELLALPIKSPGDFYNAALNHFGLARPAANKEVGLGPTAVVSNGAEAWAQLVEILVKEE